MAQSRAKFSSARTGLLKSKSPCGKHQSSVSRPPGSNEKRSSGSGAKSRLILYQQVHRFFKTRAQCRNVLVADPTRALQENESIYERHDCEHQPAMLVWASAQPFGCPR